MNREREQESIRRAGGIDRRQFLKGGAAAVSLSTGLSAGLTALAAQASAEPARVRRFVKLGSTGLEISDVSFGSSRMTDPDLPRYAFDRGVNYFDTAERYKGGRSEEAIGRGLKGVRDKVILASKTHCGTGTTQAELMEALEASLKRLQTDRVEIYFNHAVNGIDRLQNDAWYAFAEKAKEQGKIRFTGISGHGGRLVETLEHAVDGGLVDVVLCAHNFGQDPSLLQSFTKAFDFVAVQPGLPRVLEKARAKGIGVVAMKTLRGARLNDMRPYERPDGTFAQAALRWVLAGAAADALVISMNSRAEIDEYLGASGSGTLSAADRALLERHVALDAEGTCVQGCGVCENACPAGVPISEVLRTRMYDRGYRDLAYAREDYAKLALNASACATCTHTACAASCPAGLAIPEITRETHRRLAPDEALAIG
jgi:predicted aldo/keto reductase-like oxidoreductase